MTRLEELQQECRMRGFTVDPYSPGDGVTRYRFSTLTGDGRDGGGFFAVRSDFTALGWAEANTYATGRIQGYDHGTGR